MAAKEKEDKIILEREYVVPLRRKSMNTPQYKRTPKAVKVLKQFIAKHMKVSERETDNVKLDKWLNEEMWFRGIRKPMNKVRVKCKKFESGVVRVELAEIPEFVKWRKLKSEKINVKEAKKTKEPEAQKEEKKEDTQEEKEIREEKIEAVREAGKIQAESQHKEAKHVQDKEKPIIQRKSLHR